MSSLLNLFNTGSRPAAQADAAPAAQNTGWFATISGRVANAIRSIPLFAPPEQHAPFPEQMHDVLPNIFRFLRPDDLKNAKLVCKRWDPNRVLSKALKAQARDAEPLIRLWKQHGQGILEVCRNYLGIELRRIPNDHVIESPLSQLTIEERITAAACIKEWLGLIKAHSTLIKAYDTLKVWRAMAAVIHKNEEVPEFNATNVIEKAQGFAEWLDSRRNLFVAQDLDLSNLNLFTIPECLCNLDSLSVVGLNLSNNLLQFLPDAISNRPRLLTKLDVSNNLLLALPDSIGDLPKLRYLDVRDNQLSSIPDIMGNTLNVLYIDANCLHVLRASTILDQMHHLSRIIVKQQTNKQVVYSPSELKTFLSLRGTINSRFICDAASFLYDFTRDMALPLALVGIAYVVSQVYKRFAPQEILINFGGFLCHRY